MMGCKSNDWCLYKSNDREIWDRDTEEAQRSHTKMEAKIGDAATSQQCLRWLEALTSNFKPSELQENKFL